MSECSFCNDFRMISHVPELTSKQFDWFISEVRLKQSVNEIFKRQEKLHVEKIENSKICAFSQNYPNK